MFSQNRGHMLHGVLLIALFSCSSFYIGSAGIFTALSISPLIIGIVLGMIYANLLRMHLPETWVPGIQFCSKRLLRIGIILYGFRLTFQDIAAVGFAGIAVDAVIVTVTVIGGYYIGRLLKMDSETALLTSVGSGICGAAAVLGAEATIKSKPYKTAVAVATVVIFGTIAMFLYPVAYRAGILGLSPTEMGIFSGSTLHEVAHAVGAGNALGDQIASTTVIVKMIRVMMLVPVLLVLGVWAARRARMSAKGEAVGKGKVAVPWFAFGFLLVIGINSLSVYLNTLDTPMGIPAWGTDLINYIDT
ncbi:MAG: putative sulfate exporter family transporter, partial [Muribaculaceae bacterium]|nr:putative sulfate exporter family transporter [Muribaculaceae bacterium]